MTNESNRLQIYIIVANLHFYAKKVAQLNSQALNLQQISINKVISHPALQLKLCTPQTPHGTCHTAVENNHVEASVYTYYK